MEDENNEALNDSEETIDETVDDEEEVVVEKKVETPEAKRARLKRQLEQLDKKHGFKEEAKPEPKKEVSVQDGLSTDDVFVLVEAKVPREDIEEVKKAAKLLGKSIAEVLQVPLVKARLNELAEARKTADATNTGTARRGASKVSEESLLQGLSEGKIPEKGTDEAERLFWARRGGKRN